MNYAMIRYILCRALQVIGAMLLLPAIVALVYGEHRCIFVFVLVGAVIFLTGFAGTREKPANKTFYAREGMVMTGVIWIVISAMCAFVFLFSGVTKDYIDALFESVSGFSTTGASMLMTVEGVPKSILFFRCLSHWIGGMGVLVFMLAIMPKNDGYTMHLMKAEAPGPSVGKFVPKARSTAQILYYIYLGITFLLLVLLMLAGLPFYDAISMAMSTVGTGGFAVTDASADAYPLAAQIIIIVFMIMCGVNFNVYYALLTGREEDALKNEELRWYLAILFGATALIAGDIYINHSVDLSPFDSFHHSLFSVAAVMSTTGLATMNYNVWPPFAKSILFLLMVLGASAGSTAGGFKVSRLIIVLKRIRNEMIFMTHPKAIKQVTMNGRRVPGTTVKAVMVFAAIHFIFFSASLVLISFDGFDFETNVSAVMSALSNVGPGFWLVGPAGDYHIYSDFSKIVLSIDMLAGRLEYYPILILLRSGTYRNA